MSNPISELAFCGFGLENTGGTAVKSQIELDTISSSLMGKGEPLEFMSMNRGRFVKKAAQGLYQVDGDLQYRFTPDKVTKILYAILSSLSSAGTAGTGTITSTGTALVGVGTSFTTEFTSGDYIVEAGGQTRIVDVITDNTHMTVTVAYSPDVSGVAFTIAPFTHTFKTGSTLLPYTIQALYPQATNRYVFFPGLYASALAMACNIGDALVATLSSMGIGQESIQASEQSDAGIAASVLNPFIFHEAAVTLAGGASLLTRNWNLNIATGLRLFHGIGDGRTPSKAHPGTSRITGTFEMLFDTITEKRKFLGATSDTMPITPGSTLNTLAIVLTFTVDANYVLTITIPAAYYKSVDTPLTLESDNMATVAFGDIYDTSSSTDITIALKNRTAGSIITALGTNIS